jgi:hypothetical protein
MHDWTEWSSRYTTELELLVLGLDCGLLVCFAHDVVFEKRESSITYYLEVGGCLCLIQNAIILIILVFQTVIP